MGLINQFWWLAFAGCIGACALSDSSGAERVSELSTALVGDELVFGEAVELDMDNGTTFARVACNVSGQCLAVWLQGGLLLGRRYDSSGAVGDGVITLATPTDQLVWVEVAARDNEFFVVLQGNSWMGMQGVRVSALTGAVVDDPPLQIAELLQGWQLEQLTDVSTGYLLVFRHGESGTLRAVTLVDGVLQDADGLEIGPSSDASVLAGPGTQAAVVANGGLSRIDWETLTLIDQTPIDYDQWTPGGDEPALAFDGENYTVVWWSEGNVYAGRVRASDGELLDNDDLDEVSGNQVASAESSFLSAGFDGTNILAHWLETSLDAPDVVGLRISPEATRVAGDPTTGAEFTLGSVGDWYDFRVDHRATFGMAVWNVAQEWPNGNLGVEGITISGSPGQIPVGDEQSVSFSGVTHTDVTGATDGADHLVVWRSNYEDKIYARPINGLTGEPLAPAQTVVMLDNFVLVGSSPSVSVAWSGSKYLATWRDNYTISLRPLSCNGTPLGLGHTPLTNGLHHQIVCNGERCALLWVDSANTAIYAVRMTNDGDLIDTSPVPIAYDANMVGVPRIAADSAPDADERTFLIVWSNQTAIKARRFRATGEVLAETTLETVANARDIGLASDGSNVLVTWKVDDGTDDTLHARLADASSGLPLGSGAIPLATSDLIQGAVTSFDGASFLTLWGQIGVENATLGKRIDTSGDVVDAEALGIDPEVPFNLYASGTPWGRSLVLYPMEDRPHLSWLAAGRMYDNELGVGTSAYAPTCDDGSGGEGGGAGSGAGGSETIPPGGSGAGGAGAGSEGGEPSAASGASGGPAASAGATSDGGATEAGGGSNGLGGNETGGTSGEASGGNTPAGGGAGQTTGGTSAVAGTGSKKDIKSDGGCGCRAAPRNRTSGGTALLLVAALLIRRRRALAQRPDPRAGDLPRLPRLSFWL